MKNEEFGCAMQACRKVILHSSFLVLHFDKLSFILQTNHKHLLINPQKSKARSIRAFLCSHAPEVSEEGVLQYNWDKMQ